MDSNRLTLRSTISSPEDFDDFSLPSSAIDAPPLPSNAALLSHRATPEPPHLTVPSNTQTARSTTPTSGLAVEVQQTPGSPVSDLDDASVSGSPLNTLPPGSTFMRFAMPAFGFYNSSSGVGSGTSSGGGMRRVPVPSPMRLAPGGTAAGFPVFTATAHHQHSQSGPSEIGNLSPFSQPPHSSHQHSSSLSHPPPSSAGAPTPYPASSNDQPYPSPLRAITFPLPLRSHSNAGIELQHQPLRYPTPVPRSSSTPPDTTLPRPGPGIYSPSGLNPAASEPTAAARSASFPTQLYFSRSIPDSDAISIADPNPPPPYTRYPTDPMPKPEDDGRFWRRGAWRLLSGGSNGGNGQNIPPPPPVQGGECRFAALTFWSGRDGRRRSGRGYGVGGGNGGRRRGGCLGWYWAIVESERRICGVRVRWVLLGSMVVGLVLIIVGIAVGVKGRKDGSSNFLLNPPSLDPNARIPPMPTGTLLNPSNPTQPPTILSKEFPYITSGETYAAPLIKTDACSWDCLSPGITTDTKLKPPPEFPVDAFALWSCDLGNIDSSIRFEVERDPEFYPPLSSSSEKDVKTATSFSTAAREGGEFSPSRQEGEEEDSEQEEKSLPSYFYLHNETLTSLGSPSGFRLKIITPKAGGIGDKDLIHHPNPPESLLNDDVRRSYLATTPVLFEGVQKIMDDWMPLMFSKTSGTTRSSSSSDTDDEDANMNDDLLPPRILTSAFTYTKLILLKESSLQSSQSLSYPPQSPKSASQIPPFSSQIEENDAVWACLWSGTKVTVEVGPPRGWTKVWYQDVGGWEWGVPGADEKSGDGDGGGMGYWDDVHLRRVRRRRRSSEEEEEEEDQEPRERNYPPPTLTLTESLPSLPPSSRSGSSSSSSDGGSRDTLKLEPGNPEEVMRPKVSCRRMKMDKGGLGVHPRSRDSDVFTLRSGRGGCGCRWEVGV